MSHQYNDFACVHYDTDWNPHDRAGEFLRVEAKSMNVDADESKGHFDEPAKNLEENDLLLVLFWGWRAIDKHRLHPMVKDYYIGRARPIALLRDTLHMARGGSFVDRNSCPDKCAPASCPHHGEPLNAAGIRERRFGPAASQGKGKTQNAMNFGGLLRMVSASDSAARSELYRLWKIDDEIHEYLRVLYRNFPNKLTQDLLRNGLHAAGINEKITTKPEMTKALFTRYPDSGADWIRKGLYRP